MTIEIALLISGISVAFSIYFGITNNKRNKKKDDQQDASQLTTVIVKLENISTGITEIKAELNNVKNDRKEDRETIIRLDESLKAAWKRIEELIKIIETLKKKSVNMEE
jgi:peptidoglycan hydrolase CwlO-like protein